MLDLARWAGIWGHTAPEKEMPPPFFDPEVSAEVVGNLLFGIWESDGWLSREQTGGLRCGFSTTSEQLAHQTPLAPAPLGRRQLGAVGTSE